MFGSQFILLVRLLHWFSFKIHQVKGCRCMEWSQQHFIRIQVIVSNTSVELKTLSTIVPITVLISLFA